MNLNELHAGYVKDPLLVDSFSAELVQFVRAAIKSRCRRDRARMYDFLKDAEGEALLKVWANIDKFDANKSPFEAWVSQKVNDVVLNAFEKYGNRQEAELVEDEHRVRGYEDIEQRLTVKALVSDISEDDRNHVYMKMDGFSDKEVAKSFGISEKAAQQRWFRLKEKLKKHYKTGSTSDILPGLVL
jgi:RNA polymerase sigma-70 factor, ECF subfamily